MLAGHMELRHLRYFVAVAEGENVSRAALKLHVSQPALSRQIRDLEDEIGFLLLERSAKSVRLTEAGKVFHGEACAILQRVEEGMNAARSAASGGTGELHVGYAPSPTARILPPALRAFQAHSPNIRVRLHDLSTEEMLARLRDGGLRIAFLVHPRRGMLRGLRFEKLAVDAILLAVAPGHPFARRRSVKLEEAARERLLALSRVGYPEYHESLAQIFGTGKNRPRIAEEHDGINSLIAAIEAGSGVALVSQSVACLAGPRIKLVALEPAPEPLVIGAAWIKDALSPAAERFLECARAVIPE